MTNSCRSRTSWYKDALDETLMTGSLIQVPLLLISITFPAFEPCTVNSFGTSSRRPTSTLRGSSIRRSRVGVRSRSIRTTQCGPTTAFRSRASSVSAPSCRRCTCIPRRTTRSRAFRRTGCRTSNPTTWTKRHGWRRPSADRWCTVRRTFRTPAASRSSRILKVRPSGSTSP